MIRDERARGLLLAGIVVLSVIAGAIAVGPVTAQNGTDAANDTDAANATAGPSIEYVEGTGGLQARFADADANTVESIPPRTINFDIINRQYAEPYTVTITATGMNESLVEEVVYANETGLSRFGLTRDDIIGFDFTGVSPGSYEVTASPVEADASVTVPIEITGQNGTDGEAETDGDTGTDEAGNTTTEDAGAASALENLTIQSTPASANATANHTLSLAAGSDVGPLTEIEIDYSGSKASLNRVGPGTIQVANISSNRTNTSIRSNVTTANTSASGEAISLNVSGGPTINASDELVMGYGSVINPRTAGSYNVSVTLHTEDGTAASATASLDIAAANDSGGETGADTDNQTPMGDNATNETTEPANTTQVANTTQAASTTEATETTGMETTAATTQSATQTVAPTDQAATTEAATETATETETPTDEETETATEAATTDSGTPAGGPGFGIAVALVAVLAVALIAARRR